MNSEMKEVNRQIEMGWKRGRDFGLAWGITGTFLVGFLLKLLW